MKILIIKSHVNMAYFRETKAKLHTKLKLKKCCITWILIHNSINTGKHIPTIHQVDDLT